VFFKAIFKQWVHFSEKGEDKLGFEGKGTWKIGIVANMK